MAVDTLFCLQLGPPSLRFWKGRQNCNRFGGTSKQTMHVILVTTGQHRAAFLSHWFKRNRARHACQLSSHTQNCNRACYLSNNMTYGNQLSRCGVFAIVQTWDCLDLGVSSVLWSGSRKGKCFVLNNLPSTHAIFIISLLCLGIEKHVRWVIVQIVAFISN